MARRATHLDEIWELGVPVLMLDAGDMFGRRTKIEEAQTRFLCEVHGEFGFDAIGLGEWDLNYGLDFLREMIDTNGLPFTNANVRDADGKLILPEYLMVEKAGVQFGICSVFDPDQKITTMSAHDEQFVVDDPLKTLRALVPEMRKAGAQNIVLLSHLGDNKTEQLLRDMAGIDICVVGHSRRPYRTERVVGQTALLAASFESRFVGRMDGDFAADGEMKAFSVTIIDMDSKMADDPVMLKRVESFKNRLEEIRLEARGPYMPTKGSADETFMTERECRKCHSEIYETLQRSRHQSALTTLVRKGQAQSPECLVCHTTGYLYIGGYDEKPPANAMRNVQCEACHGYGSRHERGKGWAAEARDSCVQCHDAENSPNFDYTTYWEKIAH